MPGFLPMLGAKMGGDFVSRFLQERDQRAADNKTNAMQARQNMISSLTGQPGMGVPQQQAAPGLGAQLSADPGMQQLIAKLFSGDDRAQLMAELASMFNLGGGGGGGSVGPQGPRSGTGLY